MVSNYPDIRKKWYNFFDQNSDPTNFDRLWKKFHKRTDATIHTNEIAQRRQITNDVHAL